MRVGVLSDTHLKEVSPEFRKLVEFHFREVEKILHAGDFVDRAVFEYLSNLKDLIAVCGNMDPSGIRKALPHKRVIQLEGFRIGLIHGGGAPYGIEARIRGEFDDVDAIVYGHTHTPANREAENVLFFNPGSLTRPSNDQGTLGILHIGEEIEGEIIRI